MEGRDATSGWAQPLKGLGGAGAGASGANGDGAGLLASKGALFDCGGASKPNPWGSEI